MSEAQSSRAPVGLFLAIIFLLIVAAGVGGYFAWDALDGLGRQNRELDRKAGALQSSKDALEKKLDEAESERSALQSQVNELEQQTKRSARDLDAAKADLDKVKADLDKARAAAGKAAGAGEACPDLVKKIAALEAEKSDLAKKIIALQETAPPASGPESEPAKAAPECPPDPRLAPLEASLSQCQASLDAARGENAAEAERLKKTYDGLVEGLRQETQKQDIVIRRYKERLELTMLDSLLFGFGSSRITPAGRAVLDAVGRELARIPGRRVYVVGHTDDKLVRWDYAGTFHDNWQLSADRAAAVVNYLTGAFPLDPSKFTVAGRSFYQPAAPNDSRENRARNRRVEIIIGDIDL